MQNESKGIILLFIGLSVLSIIGIIVYYTNSVAVWISEVAGASSEASIGIQIIVLILAIVVLLSAIVFGLIISTLGIGYLFNITPFDMIERIQKKIFGKRFDDEFFRRF